MDILGIGIPELLFIMLIALLVMGPEDLEKAGRTLGKWLRALVKSETWQLLRKTSKELQDLPTRLMREAGEDFPTDLRADLGAWTQSIRQPLEDNQRAINQALSWPPPTEDKAGNDEPPPTPAPATDDDKEPPAS